MTKDESKENSMSEVRDDRQYTETHEWILDNGDGTYYHGYF